MVTISPTRRAECLQSPRGFGSVTRTTTSNSSVKCLFTMRSTPTARNRKLKPRRQSKNQDLTMQSTEPPRSGERVPVSLRDLSMYYLRLGAFGFGGPIALAGYMKRDLEEERHWVTHDEYQ